MKYFQNYALPFLFSLLNIFFYHHSFAQVNEGKAWNNWYFASAAISFYTAPPTVLKDSRMSAYENSTSISDQEGNLLFYTHGDTIWNRNHAVMGAVSNKYRYNKSLMAGTIIVKALSNDAVYYLITAPAVESRDTPAIRYAIIDMKANNGNGAITSRDNILYLYAYSNPAYLTGYEKLGIVKHANGNAWWLVGVKEDFEFMSFLTDESGISPNPVLSPGIKSSSQGYLSFSPDGNILGSPDGVYKFNNATGKIENLIGLVAKVPHFNAISPNGRFFYYVSGSERSLYQVDLWQTVGPDKKFVETLIYKPVSTPSGFFMMGALMLAPDSKIYINSELGEFLSVIEFPDLPGLSCGFSKNKIKLYVRPDRYVKYNMALPIIPSSAIYGSFNYSRKCNSLFLNYATEETDSVKWEIENANNSQKSIIKGDSVEYKITGKSTHFVKCLVYKNNSVDTLYSNISVDTIYDVSCTFSTIVMCKDSITLIPSDTVANAFLWSTGDSAKTIKVYKKGFYWVDRFIKGCIIRDSFELLQSPKPKLILPDTLILCEKGSLILSAGALHSSYLWTDGSTDSTLEVSKGGIYTVKVSNGCADTTGTIFVKQINCEEPDTTPSIPIIPECKVYVPNAFTPNDDHTNNYFVPVTDCQVKNYDLKIYNRWGEKIFHTENAMESWDGSFREKTCPDGCYVYLLKLQKQSGEWIYKNGMFYLIR